MADNTIALQAKAPGISDTMGAVSSILGVKQQRQQLQASQMANANSQISLQERQKVQQILSTGSDLDGTPLKESDGKPDYDKLIAAITKAAPTTGQQYIQPIQQTKSNQIALSKSAADLTETNRNAVSGIVRSFINNPQAKAKDVQDALDAYGLQNPSAVPVIHYAGNLLNHLDSAQDPAKKNEMLLHLAQSFQPAGTTASQQQPSTSAISTGGETNIEQINPQAPGGIKSQDKLQNTLSPGQQDTVLTDQLGNQYRLQRDAKGGITGVAPVPTSGSTGPAKFGPGERGALEQQANTNFSNVSANRVAASQAPQQLDQINKAIDLSKNVTTGKWAAEKAGLESGLSVIIPGLDHAGSDATKLQLLDKFSERIAADSNKVLGANASTDAARDSIHRQNANIGYTPEAVQSVLKYAKSQTLAMQAKGNAQEQWLKQSGNGITNQHDFETKWRQAYDPVLFQLEAADSAERKKIIQGLSAQEAASLKGKREELRQLGAIQ